MRRCAPALVTALLAAVIPWAGAGATSVPAAPACPLFPSNSFWHADVSKLPVDGKSATYVSSIGATASVHPDFGTVYAGAPNGIPYDVVDNSHATTSINFRYSSESDAGPYPFGSDIHIEGGSDRHAIMLNSDTCTLYELFDAR